MTLSVKVCLSILKTLFHQREKNNDSKVNDFHYNSMIPVYDLIKFINKWVEKKHFYDYMRFLNMTSLCWCVPRASSLHNPAMNDFSNFE